MEPEVLLLCSQDPASGLYPEPDESNPQLPTASTSRSSELPISFRLPN
jgi:hypothetical protein